MSEIIVGCRVETGDPFGGTYEVGEVLEIGHDQEPGEPARVVALIKWDNSAGKSWVPLSDLHREGTLRQPTRELRP